MQIGKKFCTTLYKLHCHKMSSSRLKEVEDPLVRLSGRLDFEMTHLRPSFSVEERRKYARCVSIPAGGEFLAVDNVYNFDREQKKEQQRCHGLDRGDQKMVKRDVSKQIGQTSSSLSRQTECSSSHRCRTVVCRNRYFSGRRSKLSRKPGPKLGRPIWPKTRFKRYK